MTLGERALYSQIHPFKVLVDWVAGIIALYFFWHHAFLLALCIAIIPALVVSLYIMKVSNLQRVKRSNFGFYVRTTMTKKMHALRLIGYIVMIFGAWYHVILLLFVGLGITAFAWLRGKFIKNDPTVRPA